MLPLLLFAGAFLLDIEQLAREKLTVSLLSIVGTVSRLPVAGLMFLLPGLSIPWMHAWSSARSSPPPTPSPS